jgi:hypothetical protein
MTRFNDILNGIKESVDAAQKTYKGIKRSDLKDSDFLFPETRSFPIVSPVDIPDAISNFGRMKGQMSYDAFLKKLYNMAKRKGPEFVAALPKATKEKLGIKTAKAESCGCNYEEDDVYPENEYEDNRLTLISDDDMEMEDEQEDPLEMEIEKLEKEIELELLKQKLMQIKKSKGQDFSQVETMEKESVEQEMMEYKNDFYEMSIGSIKSIMIHAQNILNALDKESVKENLTESWLQGKIAVTEDYMITVHNFVMFGPSETDTEAAEKRPGLWDNIRKKRERMGKTYKPAKPGDKDRPNPEQWKNLTK